MRGLRLEQGRGHLPRYDANRCARALPTATRAACFVGAQVHVRSRLDGADLLTVQWSATDRHLRSIALMKIRAIAYAPASETDIPDRCFRYLSAVLSSSSCPS